MSAPGASEKPVVDLMDALRKALPKDLRWYCGMCDDWFARGGDCPKCGFQLEKGQA